MKFVGIDLAWSSKNCSGATILEGNRKNAKHVASSVLLSDDEMINFIVEHVGKDDAIISIDAPLTVPNETGRRPAEDVCGKLFHKYHAGCHPANRERLSSWTGSIRGEDLVKRFKKLGYSHDPRIKKFEKTKKVLEVYPHPSIVVLFGLDSILKYKAKPKRDYAFRWVEFKKYQKHLSELEDLDLPTEIVKKDVKKLKGKDLKNYEDFLDSILCAYLSYYIWKNPERCAILGSLKGGYIMTPIFDEMWELLK